MNELKVKFAKLLEKKDSLKSSISASEAKVELYKKQIEEKLAELKEKFGFSSIEEAKKFLLESETELQKLMEEFEKKFAEV